MTFVVPSQRETVPWATSKRLSSSLLNRANTLGQRMSWTSPHPFMVGVQFRPEQPHPLFREFAAAATHVLRERAQPELPIPDGA